MKWLSTPVIQAIRSPDDFLLRRGAGNDGAAGVVIVDNGVGDQGCGDDDAAEDQRTGAAPAWDRRRRRVRWQRAGVISKR